MARQRRRRHGLGARRPRRAGRDLHQGGLPGPAAGAPGGGGRDQPGGLGGPHLPLRPQPAGTPRLRSAGGRGRGRPDEGPPADRAARRDPIRRLFRQGGAQAARGLEPGPDRRHRHLRRHRSVAAGNPGDRTLHLPRAGHAAGRHGQQPVHRGDAAAFAGRRPVVLLPQEPSGELRHARQRRHLVRRARRRRPLGGRAEHRLAAQRRKPQLRLHGRRGRVAHPRQRLPVRPQAPGRRVPVLSLEREVRGPAQPAGGRPEHPQPQRGVLPQPGSQGAHPGHGKLGLGRGQGPLRVLLGGPAELFETRVHGARPQFRRQRDGALPVRRREFPVLQQRRIPGLRRPGRVRGRTPGRDLGTLERTREPGSAGQFPGLGRLLLLPRRHRPRLPGLQPRPSRQRGPVRDPHGTPAARAQAGDPRGGPSPGGRGL